MNQIQITKEVEIIEKVFGKDSVISKPYIHPASISYDVTNVETYPTDKQFKALKKGAWLLDITQISSTHLRISKHFGRMI